MAFEEMIRNAFEESRNNTRFGDTLEELNELQEYIKNAKKIYVPNKNGIKVEVLNNVLNEYGLPEAKILPTFHFEREGWAICQLLDTGR